MGSTLTNLIFHLVFSTKGRYKSIDQKLKDELHSYLGGIIKKEGGVPIKIGGPDDHVHIVLKLKPTHNVSDIARKIKGNSSKWVNQNKKTNFHFGWQEGFGAFSVSESQINTLIKYLKNQEAHHKKTTYKEELISFFKLNDIEFDEKYLWN